MKKLYTLLFAFALVFSANAQVITQWNFDNTDPAAAKLPTTGSGTFTPIGGVVDNLTSGAMPGGNPSTGKAYSVKGFPDQGTNSGTAGFEFDVNTANFSGIYVSFDPRGSGTSSKWQQYEYSVDGTNWLVLGNNNGGLLNDFTTHIELPLPPTANNNDNFKFRIVSIFAPSSSAYEPVTTGGTYAGGTGAWRIDNFTVSAGPLGVKDNTLASLKVYPNPVTGGTLFIETANNGEKAVVVYDVLGKQVLNTKTATNAVNVSSLKGGVYIVKITEEGQTATRKLVIK